jgi:hypothetical protein
MSDPNDASGYSRSDLISQGFIHTPELMAKVAATRPAAEIEIGSLETSVFPRLAAMLREAHPRWRDDGDERVPPALPELPSLNVLGTVVALDLEEPWWKRWLVGRPGVERGELERLIASEFEPLIQALVASSQAALKKQQGAALAKATKIYLGLVEIFQEQSSEHLQRMRALMSARDAYQRGEIAASRQARIAELKRQLAVADDVRGRLGGIDQRWGGQVD